jgi:Retrotransposon gag protein/Zinc knuckle
MDPVTQQAIAAYVQQQLAAHTGLPQNAVSREMKPRLAAPPTYDGRGARGVDGWLRELRKQFAWYGTAMDGEAERIRFASAHLSDVALDWWESIEGSTRPVKWAEFETVLKARFQPANSADTARAALDVLRQGPRQPVHEYTAEFRRLLVAVPKMEEGDRVYRFVSGLHPRLAGLVRMQAPTTLADAIEKAARVDSLAATGDAAPAAPQVVASNSAVALPLGAPVPMDVNHLESASTDPLTVMARCLQSVMQQQAELSQSLNAISSGDRASRPSMPRVPNLTPEQLQDRLRRGACFRCGGVGHRKIDCPDRR